jgi:hypothetical protein
MGCICQSMINPDKEELIEGIKYLQAYDPTFNPENTKQRYLYTFQLIEQALALFSLEIFIDKIIEIIVFDSIIGNSDRHQENWAFINEYTTLNIVGGATVRYGITKSAAPIYDNGSSLGRELLDGRITQLLEKPSELAAYISKGTSEIHWNNQKVDHFGLIRQLLNSSYAEIVTKVIKRVESLFDGTKIAQIVNEIDNLVPNSLVHYKLPGNRKQLIIKMIVLRIEKLKELVHAGV